MIPLLDIPKLHAPIREELIAAITRVLDSGNYILGAELEEFERECAAYCGVKHAVGLSSGTDALIVALRALGIGPGDEVIVPAFSFVASATSVALVGADPVFVDIDPVTFNMDPAAAKTAVTARTRAAIPVHLFGRSAEMPDLDVPLIEDAAQSIGAGPLLGEMATLSFFPAKNLGCLGDGGMLLTDRDDLAQTSRELRHHGSKSKYRHERLGGNYRLDPLQAAVLRVKLPHLDVWTEERRRNAARYRENLRGVTVPEHHPNHVYNQFVIRSPRRDAIAAALKAVDVATAIYYPDTLPAQPVFGGRRGDWPHAEQACREVLALPVAPGTTLEAIDRVCEIVNAS